MQGLDLLLLPSSSLTMFVLPAWLPRDSLVASLVLNRFNASFWSPWMIFYAYARLQGPLKGYSYLNRPFIYKHYRNHANTVKHLFSLPHFKNLARNIYFCMTRPTKWKIAIACAQEISEGVNFNSHKHMKSIMMPRLVALIFLIKPWIYFQFL